MRRARSYPCCKARLPVGGIIRIRLVDLDALKAAKSVKRDGRIGRDISQACGQSELIEIVAVAERIHCDKSCTLFYRKLAADALGSDKHSVAVESAVLPIERIIVKRRVVEGASID